MANFPGLILTDAGRQLQAKAQIGQQLQFTRVGLGSGTMPADPEALTALVSEELTVSIQSFEVIGDGTSKIRAILTNDGLATGFFVREIGVFARDPDTLVETLYSYANSDTQSDFLPAGGGATVVEQIFDLITVIGTATNVTAVIDDFITIATKADIEEIRPYLVPEAGLSGQLMRKATNAEGDTEWFDIGDGISVLVSSISEVRTAIEGQTVFNLAETRTSGLAVYVEGVRLRADEWQALNATQVQLDNALAAGTKVEFINNEEVGAVSGGGGTLVTLSGPDLVFPGSTNTYTITNFDAFSTYAVASDVGTVSIADDIITLVIDAGQAAGQLNLSVTRNSSTVVFQIAVGAQSVAQPEILNPANGATDVGSGVTLTTSAFLTYPNGADTHASTDWQVATDAGFTAIVFESLADASNLESIAVPSGTFNTSTTYYTRARHNGTTLGASPYSATVSFGTAAGFAPSNEVAKLLASDGAAGDVFGDSVSISGNYAIVGAKNDDDNGTDSGSAYIFERDGAGTWTEVAKITGSAASAGHRFGESVSISGSYAIVGATFSAANGTGAAYIFERDGAGTWTEVAMRTPEAGFSATNFGISVAISEDYAIVGGDSPNGLGAAYIYERDAAGNWTTAGQLRGSDTATNDYFGKSVAIFGNYAIVGADGDDDSGSDSGSAYIFQRLGENNWAQAAKITASDGATFHYFGTSVAISADCAMVGSPLDSANGSQSGSVYVFERDGSGAWGQSQKLLASDGAAGDRFGMGVSISGNYAIVGAQVDQSAYIFERDGAGTWAQLSKLIASDNAAGDQFGAVVSISGSYAIVGAFDDDDNGTGSGSAYIFE